MKILMTLMGLDIGGAETHVLELSKALSEMGAKITVASNGGVYQKELSEAGIEHVTLPLHTKNPLAVIKSYFGLKKLIKKEKFDIVHAHARIPAFICGLLQRRLHFRFVTSAHWVFDVNPVWKRISDWGEKTIAVSEDIKQYVVDNYGVFPDNISVTINGVDMNKFSPDTDHTDLESELNLPKKRKTIVYVSRMDTDRSAAARMLTSISSTLKDRYPDLHVVIVGGGNDFEYVKNLADKANAEKGEKFVHMAGGRTDINRFIAIGDVFIGVSRAVLEAMSAAKPVIIAGNEGYIGILSEENFDIAAATNFCCRGCTKTTESQLLHDVDMLLSLKNDEKQIIGDKNRNIIKEHYSAARMAKDCMKVYSSLYPYEHKKYGDIIFSGYYGFGNMGDDSLLLSIIDNLKANAPDIKITAFTKNPQKMQKKYGVKCVGRFNVFAMIREMKHAKLLISGGGSLFQNNTSAKSLEYYIQVIKTAKRLGLPVSVYANGIGPLYGKRSHRKVRDILSIADDISLREPSSFEFLKSIGASQDLLSRIRVSADPALTLTGAPTARVDYILEKSNILDPEKCFAVSLREWEYLKTSSALGERESFIERISDSIALLSSSFGLTPVFIPVQRAFDDNICEQVKALTEQKLEKSLPILKGLTAREVIGIIGKMSFVMGMRLHMLIYASAAGVPAIGMSYDPKIDAFLEYSRQIGVFDFNKSSKKELLSIVSQMITHREELCDIIKNRANELSSLAKDDALRALEFVK